MYILLDSPTDEELIRIYDHINELDDRMIDDNVSGADTYFPNDGTHIFDSITLPEEVNRWEHLYLAAKGARLYSNKITEKSPYFNSPLYAGPIPEAAKTRKVSVDGAFAEGRAGYYNQFGVNYIGRTKLAPRNIFVLDNKKGNSRLHPSKDATLEALYASLPDDWWGSCGFVSTANADKLVAFLESFYGDVIPLAFTTGAYAKLKYGGFDYVDTGLPRPTEEFGIQVRDAANRLSYKLSLTPEERAALEQ